MEIKNKLNRTISHNAYDFTTTTTFDDLANHTAFWEKSGLESILVRCAVSFGTTTDEVKSRSRTERIVLARHAYCYKAYCDTQQSAKIIGMLIGRDHATVCHSIKIAKNFIKIDYRRFTDIYNMLLLD